MAIGRRYAALPDAGRGTPEDFLGYDENGLAWWPWWIVRLLLGAVGGERRAARLSVLKDRRHSKARGAGWVNSLRRVNGIWVSDLPS